MSEVQVRYFLFADVQGYSKLRDQDIARFAEEFLGGIAEVISGVGSEGEAKIQVEDESSNTWGDAFLFVFRSAAQAGGAALAIRDWVQENPFFPSDRTEALGLRIGMHGGPVLTVQDPIRKKQNFLGSHINRAARIEPITEGGQIFVSWEFAALAAAEGVSSFNCVPQGLADLPKAGGRIPVYRLDACPTAEPDQEQKGVLSK